MIKKPPRLMQKALADLYRWGHLVRFGADQWAAEKIHLPQLAHDDRTIAAIVAGNYAQEVPSEPPRVEITTIGRNLHETILSGAAA